MSPRATFVPPRAYEFKESSASVLSSPFIRGKDVRFDRVKKGNLRVCWGELNGGESTGKFSVC